MIDIPKAIKEMKYSFLRLDRNLNINEIIIITIPIGIPKKWETLLKISCLNV